MSVLFRARRVAAYVTVIFVGAVVLFEIYALIADGQGDTPLPMLFGNFPHIRAVLENAPPKDEFRFAVVGDTKSMGTFESITNSLRDTPLDFAVLLGDCTYHGSEREHRFLHAECAREYAMPFPVFYIVGNHDVSAEKFPIARFEKMYGPSVFTFEYQECLFIFLRVLDPPASNEESIALLRTLRSSGVERYQRRFAFMHIPPLRSPDVVAREFPEAEDVVRLLEDLQVDYVFAGDFHGYARIERHGVNYVITGGGGAHLAQKASGQFHHAVVMTVAEDSVSEHIVSVRTRYDLEDLIERHALIGVSPWLRRYKSAAVAINAALAAVVCVAVISLRKNSTGRARG